MTDIVAGPMPHSRGLSRRRSRFLIVSIAALAVLAIALGVSFTSDTGTTTVSVTGTTSALVLTGTLADGKTYKVSGGTARTAPSWTPVAGSAGGVTTKGDIAFIDGRTTAAGGGANLTITIYVTNLVALQQAYSSYAWPVRIYSGTYNGTTTSWSGAAIVASSDTTYLTNTGGFLSFSVATAASGAAGSALAVQLAGDAAGDGGSFYTISTSNGSLNPTFFITAQPS